MLNDGSTDSSIIEQELIYILFLNEGVPTLKYFSIDSVSNVDVVGIKETIKTTFAYFGVSNFTMGLLGLNVGGASVNMGIHQGVATLITQEAPCPLF